MLAVTFALRRLEYHVLQRNVAISFINAAALLAYKPTNISVLGLFAIPNVGT